MCGDIVEELPLAQSTVSQHLKVLKEAGLIRGNVDGPRVCYCIEPRALLRLKLLVSGLDGYRQSLRGRKNSCR
jgi:ArsR family transcriptional regulator